MTKTNTSEEEIDSTSEIPSIEPSTLQGQDGNLSRAQDTESGTQDSIIRVTEGASEASASHSDNSAPSNQDSDAHYDTISDVAVLESSQAPGQILACQPDEESGNAYSVPCLVRDLCPEEDISSDTEDVEYLKKAWPCSSLCMNSRRLLVSITALLLVAAVITAVIVPFRGNRNVESNNNGNGATLVDQKAIYEMRSYILKQDWSDPISVLDPTAPQFKAIQQLAFEGAPLDTTLEQRYAILVVWYGLGREDINDQHECHWKGLIQCDSLLRVTALTMKERDLQGTISEEIGMLTNLGECVSRSFAMANIAVSISSLFFSKFSWILIIIRFKAPFRHVSTTLSN